MRRSRRSSWYFLALLCGALMTLMPLLARPVGAANNIQAITAEGTGIVSSTGSPLLTAVTVAKGGAAGSTVTTDTAVMCVRGLVTPQVRVDRTVPLTSGSTKTWSAFDPEFLELAATVSSATITVRAYSSTTITNNVPSCAGSILDTKTFTLTIESVKPTIAVTPSASPNADGWHDGDVTVNLTTDQKQGPPVTEITYSATGAQAIASTKVDDSSTSVTISTEGTTTLTATAKSTRSNLTSLEGSVTVKIDKTLPTLSGAPTASPNAAGWYNGDVTIVWTCGDTLSGIAGDGSCPVDGTVVGEGTGLTTSASVSDKAGNSSGSVNSPAVNIDRTAPITTAGVTPSPSAGVYLGAPTITLSSNDTLSGVATIYYQIDAGTPQTYAAPFAFDLGGAHTLTYWSVDVAGNTEDNNAQSQQLNLTVDNNLITFATLPDRTLDDAPFALTATASSGLQVAFSAAGSCTVAGDTVTLSAAGSCAVTATQAGDGTHNAATPVTRTFTINAASPSPSPSPSTSPSPSPQAQYALTVSVVGGGTVSGAGTYDGGTVVTLVATPNSGQIFTDWTLDGAVVGWAPSLTLTVDAAHTIVATFAARPMFDDVSGGTLYSEAIAQLAARGIINGYGDGDFGPVDTVLRAQAAALVARGLGWESEAHGNPFSDQGTVDADLWRNVGTLAFYGVARGFGDGTYQPTGNVAHAQAISLITRSMIAKGYWVAQPVDPARIPGIPAASGHQQDLATFVHYAGLSRPRPMASPGMARTAGTSPPRAVGSPRFSGKP